MSEILRGVLDASCIDSNPAFYTATLTYVETLAGAGVYALKNAVIQCKADTHFLMMGWVMDSTFLFPGGPNRWDSKARFSGFTVQNMNTGEFLTSNGPIPRSNMGYNLNNFVVLPEYYLWEPSELIGVTMSALVAEPAPLYTDNLFVTLAGIEYKMPSGKG